MYLQCSEYTYKFSLQMDTTDSKLTAVCTLMGMAFHLSQNTTPNIVMVIMAHEFQKGYVID